MAQKRLYIILLISFAVILLTSAVGMISCKNNKDDITNNQPVVEDHTPLTTGNYWIYRRYIIDTAGNVTPTSIFDSCYIEKDTIIYGETYYKYISPDAISPSKLNYTYLRDSLHYLINRDHHILFSSEDHTTVFDHHYNISGSDTLYELIHKMSDSIYIVQTNAGNFQALNSGKIYYLNPSFFPHTLRVENTLYAPGVGIVNETLHDYLSNPNKTERRLERYFINEPLTIQQK